MKPQQIVLRGAMPEMKAVEPPTITGRLTLLFAACCALEASGLYFAQPLTGPIGAALGLPHAATGLIVTLTQLGYGAGLVLLGPLGDLLENRRLVVAVMLASAVSLAATGLAAGPGTFLAACLALGVTASVIQIMVPFAASLAPERTRGATVGSVMSGLMVGLLLGRPVASVTAQYFGWRYVFLGAAVLTLAMALLVRRLLPRRDPRAGFGYAALLRSLLTLLLTVPELRRRALYQALLFGAFSLFWTAVPFYLAGRFHLDQNGIALFALAGAGGALSAPVAGRLADRGWTVPATAAAMLMVLAAFASTLLTWLGLAGLVVAAMVLDAGVQANVVLSQRLLYLLNPAIRGRLNGLLIALFFMGGAAGSAVATPLVAHGWRAVALVGSAMPVLALLAYGVEFCRWNGLPGRR
jgi:predicted MFS family arabinose efflux permease